MNHFNRSTSTAIPSLLDNSGSWEQNGAHFRLNPGFSYYPGSLDPNLDPAISRIRLAQAAAAVAANQINIDPAQLLANTTRIRNPFGIQLADSTQNTVPLVS